MQQIRLFFESLNLIYPKTLFGKHLTTTKSNASLKPQQQQNLMQERIKSSFFVKVKKFIERHLLHSR